MKLHKHGPSILPSIRPRLKTAEPEADEGARSDPEDGEAGAALADAGGGEAPAAARLPGEASAARLHHVGGGAAEAEGGLQLLHLQRRQGGQGGQGEGVLAVRAPREEARQRRRPRLQVSQSAVSVLSFQPLARWTTDRPTDRSSGFLSNSSAEDIFINENVDFRDKFKWCKRKTKNNVHVTVLIIRPMIPSRPTMHLDTARLKCLHPSTKRRRRIF